MISYTSLHTQYAIADAIQRGIVVLGRQASIGRYQLATGKRFYAVIPAIRTGQPETQHTDSGGAAHRFCTLEGDYNSAVALDRAINDWLL